MFDHDCTLYQLEKASKESNWVLLGSSKLKIVFNEKMRCYRVIAQDCNQHCMCDTVIAIKTEMKVPLFYLGYHHFQFNRNVFFLFQVDGTMFTWSAFDYSKKESCHRTFLAHFNRETQYKSITDAAEKFKSVFSKVVVY